MKGKYIEERYPRWFTNGDTIIAFNTPREADGFGVLPEAVINEHNLTVQTLIGTALAFYEAAPEAFNAFWYGSPEALPSDTGLAGDKGPLPTHNGEPTQ